MEVYGDCPWRLKRKAQELIAHVLAGESVTLVSPNAQAAEMVMAEVARQVQASSLPVWSWLEPS